MAVDFELDWLQVAARVVPYRKSLLKKVKEFENHLLYRSDFVKRLWRISAFTTDEEMCFAFDYLKISKEEFEKKIAEESKTDLVKFEFASCRGLKFTIYEFQVESTKVYAVFLFNES